MVRRLLCWGGLLAARLSVVAYDVALWAENRIHAIDRAADRAGRVMVRRLLCWGGLLAARLSVVAYDVALWAENRIHAIDRAADRAGGA